MSAKKYLMGCTTCGAIFWKAAPKNTTKCPVCGGRTQILKPKD